MTTPAPDKAVRNSRLKLLLIAAVFAAPIIAAAILTASGWQPKGKGNGQPILPQRNFVDRPVHIALADGTRYAWRDSEPRLTLVALAGPQLRTHCVATLTAMAAARVTLNRNAPRLRLLYIGDAAGGRAGARRPARARCQPRRRMAARTRRRRQAGEPSCPTAPDSVSALLVESNGTALSYYPAGFDTTGLRKDLQKVVR